MAVVSRALQYEVAGTQFHGYFAWDSAASGPLPAVLIAPTWAGCSAFEQDKAQQLAASGYAVLALDLYGEGRLGSGPEENAELMAPLMADRSALQARLATAVSAAAALPEVDADRMAAIGYCFGGLCVLDLARIGAPLRGVVSIHGLFTPPDNLTASSIEASVLCLHGYDDPMAEPASLLALADEMTAAGADWQVHAYGNTVHAFTNPAANNPGLGALYSPAADRRSWCALQNFLEEVLA